MHFNQPPLHDTHYTDEETEVQRGEGTFLNFYCTGLSDYYPQGGGQQVRHIRSLPWFWLIGLGPRRSCRPTAQLSEMGMLRCGWPGDRPVANAIPSVCGLRRGPGLHPHTPQQRPKPSCLPVPSSKKCGSLITSPASFPRGYSRYSGSRQEMPEASEREGTCPAAQDG